MKHYQKPDGSIHAFEPDGSQDYLITGDMEPLGVEELAALREPSIAEKKAMAWAAIKAKREHLSDTGGYMVPVGGVEKWFHSDPKSKGQQMGLVLAGAAAATVPPWKTMDGSKVPMSQALAGQIFQAAMTMEGAIFQAAETHRSAMEASADPLAYDFSTGWPDVFTG